MTGQATEQATGQATEFKINSVLGNVSQEDILTTIQERNAKKRERLSECMNIGFTKRVKVKDTDIVKVNKTLLTDDTKSVNTIGVFYNAQNGNKEISTQYGYNFIEMFESVESDFDKQAITNLFKKVVVKL